MKKNLVQKKFYQKKKYGQKKNFGLKNFFGPKVLSCMDILSKQKQHLVVTANQCIEFFKVLNAMFRIVLILSADNDDIHFLRHLLKYLHKQHPFKSIGFDIKAIQSCIGYFQYFFYETLP